MSYPFSPYTSVIPMGDASSINSSLLTPPLTPRSEHDVPYRPTETDQISLSMKKRKRATKGKNKKEPKDTQKWSLRSTGANDTQTDKSGALFSDESNRRKSLSVHTGAANGSSWEDTHNDVKKLRRWTLPSKSGPTSVFTPLRSTVKQATLTTRPESPAMITLQRATTNRSPKRVEMTFFPEPKFGNERSGLLSYIVSTFSRSEMSRPADQSGTRRPSTTIKSARSASVGSDGAHPTLTFPAATVCTETFVESSLAMPGAFTADASPRRCSTKYTTRDSCFEIIWDENDNSSSTQDSSRPSLTSDRRPSLAATKLEAQLAQNLQSIRRFSAQSGSSSSTDSQDSVGNFLERVITPEKLNSLFPKLLRDTALRNLPRSRGGGHGREDICNIATLDSSCLVTKDDSGRRHAKSGDLFPPLQKSRSSNSDDDWRKPASMSQSDSQAFRRASASLAPSQGGHLGSMIGSSSHTRRRSSASAKWQQGPKNKKRYSIPGGGAQYGQIDDAGMTPLLRTRPRHQSTQ